MQKVTSKDGTVIAFDQTGHGPVVILVSGALGDRMAAVPLTPLLSPHFTVLAYDRRGRGDSGDTAPYAVEREVEDIEALIKATGGSAFVHGHSSGAVLALEAAAHTRAITRLALYEPPFILDASRPLPPRDYVPHLNELVSTGRRGDAVEYFMTAVVGAPDGIVTQMRQSAMWAGMEKIAHTLAYDGQIMDDNMAGHPLQAEQWATVTVPTLVMDGGASEAWAHHAVQALTDALPDARRRTLEGQTHSVDPAILAPFLIAFFQA
jgi:pimeloyl-ACP methyl ester carboxylesterase